MFGKDWHTDSSTRTGDTAGALYGGPDGARVTVVIEWSPEDPNRARSAWGVWTQDLGRIQSIIYNPVSEQRPTINGCGSVARLAGLDPLDYATPLGITACDADVTHRLIWVYVVGTVLGKQGTAASDAVVEAIVHMPNP